VLRDARPQAVARARLECTLRPWNRPRHDRSLGADDRRRRGLPRRGRRL
jgi:hypothetical protein